MVVLFFPYIWLLLHSWETEKMLCVIYGDLWITHSIVFQSMRSSHAGLSDPQWSSSYYAHSDEFPYYRDDSPDGFFSSLLKRERVLLCPCRVDTVILSALNLAWLCWDRESFLCFSWTHCEKMEFRIQRRCLCGFYEFGDLGKKCPLANYHPTHKKGGWKCSGVTWICPIGFDLKACHGA